MVDAGCLGALDKAPRNQGNSTDEVCGTNCPMLQVGGQNGPMLPQFSLFISNGDNNLKRGTLALPVHKLGRD